MKNKIIYILVFFLNFSFLFSQTYFNDKKVNTNPLNKKYKDSRKYFYGKLDSDEYKNIILQLELELKTKFPEEKSIFINFEQAASNCSLLKANEKYLQNYYNMCVNISNRISKENNAIDFFIYDNNTFLKNYVIKNINFKIDSGFFAKNIFTEKDNCKAFFILKPDGNFLISYGTDAFSYASNFLKQK